jgi:signal transduction histidine kinase
MHHMETDEQMKRAQYSVGTQQIRHDVNNALAGILGGLQLVGRRHKDDERTRQIVENAVENLTNLRAALRDVL